MKRELRIGSRESELALAQARLVMGALVRAHPEISPRLVAMKSRGDLLPDLPLEEAGGKGLFTGLLEEALGRGEIDLCVHSLKDLGMDQGGDLPLVAMLRRGDPRDALVLPRTGPFEGFGELGFPAEGGEIPAAPPGESLSLSLSRLAGGPPAGSSSPRRRMQLAALAPALRCAPIRGNVPTRLAKMDGGRYGALILAAAGLSRLGIRGRRGHIFSVEEMIPAPGQGILALQGRRGEDYRFLEALRDPPTEEEARAERAFVRAAGGGCGAPCAVYARIRGNEIVLRALYAADGLSPFHRDTAAGPREQGPRLAEELARRLLARGAGG